MKRSNSIAAALVVAFTLVLPASGHALGAKIKYKLPKKLDEMKVAHRVVPLTGSISPDEDVVFSLQINFGVVFGYPIQALYFQGGNNGHVWKYKVKKHSDPDFYPPDWTPIYFLKIKEKFDPKLNSYTYVLKMKATAILQSGNPDWPPNAGVDEIDFATMHSEFIIGDDLFYLDAVWTRKPYGWKLLEKEMTADLLPGGGTLLYAPPTSTTTTTIPGYGSR